MSAHDRPPSDFSVRAVAALPAAFVERFRGSWPFVRHAGHWLVALQDDAPLVESQEDFEALYRRLDSAQVQTFVRKVARYRAQVRRVRQADWLCAHQLSAGITALFAHSPLPLYVVTARDQASVDEVLGAAGLTVPPGRICGEQQTKVPALAEIQKREQVQPEDLLLVDDHLEHVLAARRAGYQGAWALWGTTPTEREVQAARHHRITRLHSVEELNRLLHRQ
jgi:phosphoglycolate phosphatase-like HAD superfamily hydrolase